jgi:TatA/E family protein of Tat protein translocase
MLENIGGGELIIILIVVFLFWGPTKLPEIGKYIGKGVFEFRRAMREVQDNLDIPNEIRDIRSNIDISQKIEDIKTNITNEIIKENNSQSKQDT